MNPRKKRHEETQRLVGENVFLANILQRLVPHCSDKLFTEDGVDRDDYEELIEKSKTGRCGDEEEEEDSEDADSQKLSSEG